VARERRAFERVHAALAAADGVVDTAEHELFARLEDVGPLDISVDQLVRDLQVSLIGDGFPRPNPFIFLGFKPAADIVRMPDEEEARLVMRLAAETLRATSASRASKELARGLAKAAAAVLGAVSHQRECEEALRHATKARDGLLAEWDGALEALRTALRLSDLKKHTTAYRAVFGA
jgi:hypothetical protein